MVARKHINEDRLRELWAKNATGNDIGAELGCSDAHVHKVAAKLGLPRRTRKMVQKPYPLRKPSECCKRGIPAEDIARLWATDLPLKVIAERLGCSNTNVALRAKKMGLPPRNMPFGRPPIIHTAAVRMPDTPLRDRADYPDLVAAVERAKASRGPVVALGQVAARYRLPVAVVQGLAGRVG